MSQCKYCNKEIQLIKAHIIPEAFWEIDHSFPIPLKVISNNKGEFPRKSYSGIYDKDILCKKCDSWLGKEFDEYATEKLLRYSSDEYGYHEGVPVGRIYKGLDLTIIKRFFISVLWRCHLSKRTEFNDVSLGPWADIVKEALTKRECLAKIEVYLAEFDQKHIGWLNPHRHRLEGINIVQIYINRFIAYVKIDKRDFPAPFANCAIKKTGDLVVIMRDFSQSKEIELMKKMVKLHPNLFPPINKGGDYED